MLKQTNHRSLTLILLFTLFFLAAPSGGHLATAQQQAYNAGDVVEVKWIDKWVMAKVDKCLNASTCMVYFYDVRTGTYDTRSTAIMMDHIRTTAKRPPIKSEKSKEGSEDAAAD